MTVRKTLLSLVVLILGFAVALATEASPGFLAVPEGEVEFEQDTYSAGEAVDFFIRDSDLASFDSCTATWTEIPSPVNVFEFWNLSTGEPHLEVYSLSPGCIYDRSTPFNTPLPWPPAPLPEIEVDGIAASLSDYKPDEGRFSLDSAANASSTVVAFFHFHVADTYSEFDQRVRVSSTSDQQGEWIAIGEVTSESDATPSPVSGLFRGEISISTDQMAQAPGDGAVWVQHGDSLTVAYFEPDGTTLLSEDTATLDIPTPTPTPTLTPTATSTPVATPTPTATSTPIIMPTLTNTPVTTPIPTATYTPTVTPTPANTPVDTPTSTATQIPTSTPTATPTPVATSTPTVTPTPTPVTCEFSGTSEPVIKGNINDDGDKIYHTPDSFNYDQVSIDESEGERLFCTVQEAEDAGWRPPHQLAPTPTPIPSASPLSLAALAVAFVLLLSWRLRARPQA